MPSNIVFFKSLEIIVIFHELHSQWIIKKCSQCFINCSCNDSDEIVNHEKTGNFIFCWKFLQASALMRLH